MSTEWMKDFEKSVLEVLNNIDSGKELLYPNQVKEAKKTLGDCHFDVGKFVFKVFNDCGQWDYISEVWRGGKKLTHYQMSKYTPKLYNWRPKHPEYWGMD